MEDSMKNALFFSRAMREIHVTALLIVIAFAVAITLVTALLWGHPLIPWRTVFLWVIFGFLMFLAGKMMDKYHME